MNDGKLLYRRYRCRKSTAQATFTNATTDQSITRPIAYPRIVPLQRNDVVPTSTQGTAMPSLCSTRIEKIRLRRIFNLA
jgi:hypothetical protein